MIFGDFRCLKDISPVFLAILKAISGNVLFHWNILLEEEKTNLLQLLIPQNNREKHGFMVNKYRNEFMVGTIINKCLHRFTIKSNW